MGMFTLLTMYARNCLSLVAPPPPLQGAATSTGSATGSAGNSTTSSTTGAAGNSTGSAVPYLKDFGH